ncbi:MAG: rRNA pseudouridine synthase [Firmicutes bacterium]|nr:rRNA pseudouridine synthase [Bacillota bacterium]
MGRERLQKVLARCGVASRRASEELILAGRVQVNGKTVQTLGVKVDPAIDKISVDGKLIKAPQVKVYYLLNKPTGVISSCHDPQGRTTIMDLMPGVKERIYPVGRLDYDSEGLVLLTNDGHATLVFTHPRYQVRKSYLVEVEGFPTEGTIRCLARGVKLSDGWTAPARVKIMEKSSHSTLLVLEIHEGRNRQIRRMCNAVGHRVVSLKRFRMGPLDLEGLGLGQYRRLRPPEVSELLAFVDQARSTVEKRK